jgi:transcriptional regulator with XRE-family HTH domain
MGATMTHNNVPKEAPRRGDPELGGRLSLIRLRAGLTQTDVAGKVTVSRQHISNIETGITSPTVRLLQDYLQACGTDLPEFFYGPLPVNQTPRQRDYHRKLQALLENAMTSPIVTKVIDSFLASMQSSLTALVQPVRVQARRPRARLKKEDPSRKADLKVSWFAWLANLQVLSMRRVWNIVGQILEFERPWTGVSAAWQSVLNRRSEKLVPHE